jgi:hypothetical protein
MKSLRHQLQANEHAWKTALETVNSRHKQFVSNIAKHVIKELENFSTNSRLLHREHAQELRDALQSLNDSKHAIALKLQQVQAQQDEKSQVRLQLTARRCWMLLRVKLADRIATKLNHRRLEEAQSNYNMPSQWLDQPAKALPSTPQPQAQTSTLSESRRSSTQASLKSHDRQAVVRHEAVAELQEQLQAAQAETDTLRTVITGLQADIASLQYPLEDESSRPSSGRRQESAGDRAARVLRLITQFERLMAQGQMFDAATLAITGVEGTLRNRKTWLRFDHPSLDTRKGWYVYSHALLHHQPTCLEQAWCVDAALRRQHLAELGSWASEGMIQASSLVLWQLWQGLLKSSPEWREQLRAVSLRCCLHSATPVRADVDNDPGVSDDAGADTDWPLLSCSPAAARLTRQAWHWLFGNSLRSTPDVIPLSLVKEQVWNLLQLITDSRTMLQECAQPDTHDLYHRCDWLTEELTRLLAQDMVEQSVRELEQESDGSLSGRN